MLLRLCLHGVGPISNLQIRQRRADGLRFLVFSLLVNRQKTGEADALVAGAEGIAGTLGINGDCIIQGVRHLGGQEPAPDQLIQPVLLPGQASLNLLRVQFHMGGTDGFMGILRRGFCFECVEFPVVVLLAVAGFNKLCRRCHGLIGQAQGVGTHIGDETQRALTCHIHALIELLGDGHGALGGHIQLSGGLLLQGGGGKGRGCGTLLLCPLDTGDGKLLPLNGIQHRLYLILIFQFFLFIPAMVMGRKGAGFPDPVQLHIHRPVLFGLECPDLVFPVHHKAGGYRLDAACRQASAHLLPQQGRELIAHDPIQNSSGLLGIYQILINRSGMGNGLPHNLLCNLVKGNAAGLAVRQIQKFFQVPGDRFALPVRVRCQIDHICLSGGFLQLVNQILFTLDGYILRLEISFDIHAHGTLGQIPQMTHTGLDGIIQPQIAADGFGFGGRLHDHKITRFAHL